MSEVATFLKVGTTAIVLSMIEDDMVGDDLTLAHPVTAIRQVSNDPSLRATIALGNGKRMTALDVQWQLLERARVWADRHGLDSVTVDDGKRILEEWESVLTGLERNPDDVADVVDWVAKKRLVDGYAQRHHLPPTDARLKAIDLQYSDLRRERSLALRCGLRTVAADAAVQEAIDTPPETTRAYFRGTCLAKYAANIVAANWDSIVFDVGRDPLRRVPMMEPLRGTKALTAELFSSSATAAELIARLADSPQT
jgi:proteasome accessory factor A